MGNRKCIFLLIGTEIWGNFAEGLWSVRDGGDRGAPVRKRDEFPWADSVVTHARLEHPSPGNDVGLGSMPPRHASLLRGQRALHPPHAWIGPCLHCCLLDWPVFRDGVNKLPFKPREEMKFLFNIELLFTFISEITLPNIQSIDRFLICTRI